MPIRIKSKSGRRGKLSASFDAWTASVSGTSTAAAAFNGTIHGLIYDWTAAIAGIYLPTSVVNGVLTAQLEHWTAAITGTETYEPQWAVANNFSLGTFPLTGGTVNLNDPFYVNNPDGDPLEFTTAGGTGSVSTAGVLTVPAGTAGTYYVDVDLNAAFVSTSLTTLTLTNGGDGKAWTFGQAFKHGDVPTGQYITATGPTSFQADVRNRWADGSVKFAVLSGIGGSSADLLTTGTTPATGEVALSSSPASVTITGTGAGTYVCPTTNTVGAWNKAASTLVRKIAGPVMTERHYYVPTSDAHLAVWFYVRSYVGGSVEVETAIENGWLNVATPTSKSYTVTVTVGGTVRYGPTALTHLHHTRWSRADWVGSDPAITPQHNAAYLRSTKLVPNYGYTSPTSAAFTSLATALNSTPFILGNWPTPNMANPSNQDMVAIVPRWEALYCTSADSRAYAATISNTRGVGRYPMHYRDETTGRPLVQATYAANVIYDFPVGGAQADEWELQHHPSAGYVAYLISGRWLALETLQFSASYNALASPVAARMGYGAIVCQNAPMTTRGAAWAWRTIGQAAAVSPTSGVAAADLTLQPSYATCLTNSADWMKRRYIDGTITNGTGYPSYPAGSFANTIGWIGHYDSYAGTGVPSDQFWGGAWMVMYQASVLGFVSDLGIEGMTMTNWNAVRDFCYENPVQQLGDESSWNFRRGGVYARPYLKGYSGSFDNPQFMTIQEAFAAYKSFEGLSALSITSPYTLKDHEAESDVIPSSSSNTADGYWAYALTALTFAVDHGKSGAAAKLDLVKAATNYDPSSRAHDNPQWAVVPR